MSRRKHLKTILSVIPDDTAKWDILAIQYGRKIKMYDLVDSRLFISKKNERKLISLLLELNDRGWIDSKYTNDLKKAIVKRTQAGTNALSNKLNYWSYSEMRISERKHFLSISISLIAIIISMISLLIALR